MGLLYKAQGNYTEALPLYKKSLTINSKISMGRVLKK
ncbi:MAG: tetratricopeptide repeat protein [Candidatus Midichloria sp.]